MNDRFFIDTDIFVYTFDDRDESKRARAQAVVEQGLRTGNGIISFQVVQEFLNVATRKFATPLRTDDCRLYVDKVLAPMCEIHSSIGLYRDALDISERWQLSFFDSLIVAAALAADCAVLWSEDLQDGQTIRDLTIQNPF